MSSLMKVVKIMLKKIEQLWDDKPGIKGSEVHI